MQLRSLGKSDLKISPILMGTWQAGKEMWVGIDDVQTTSAIRAAFEAGITSFDTAEAYGKGHSERVLGAAVSDFRDRVILATKVFPNHLKAEQVTEACHRSLKNLNADVIDLYQIHWPAGSFRTKAGSHWRDNGRPQPAKRRRQDPSDRRVQLFSPAVRGGIPIRPH